ncbi:hypothetical protein BABINDRAFT_34996 [Babjeviella inositovora NRRL Y-12698]|uniref:Rhodanese domain-containing protein n=1 Tax=Babjeviella inositovora NRRL Y-12698 TaxID=984486 RepID=A0A1E3QSX6_9ASCO|nr:uncharacterized protein BABINDRAFT_34996 [Babjeviella inositovora NRRL Y-12698]ODQ80748.1 hypothetical protein BABINDRAFT_34996 [Babjeviella inositovora NRRL Y-12698]
MLQPIYALSDLQFIGSRTLRAWFRGGSPNGQGNFAVVDVRESDFIGGHIKGCLHYPAGRFMETILELQEKLKAYDDVVFHCALSQVRGPSSSLKFLRSLNELPPLERAGFEHLNVWVLKGGFTEWQAEFGEDKEVTEDYQKDLWEFY